VYVLYLLGHYPNEVRQGDTRLVSLGGANKWGDLLLAPWRLARFARELGANSVFLLTADMVFSWWASFLLQLSSKAKLVLMPVCMPESVYSTTGRAISRVLPIWLEKLLIKLSFLMADRIIASVNHTSFLKWLESDMMARKKVRRVTALVDEFPSPEFFSRINKNSEGREEEAANVLLYVGRLHPEKLTMDLIQMMGLLKDWGVGARLEIVGEGQDLQFMEAKVNELGLSDRVVFHGALPNLELIPIYKRATVFVSTLTGTSLREAGLLGLPVVAYDFDWVSGLLEHKKTAFLARARDPEDLARKVSCALRDPLLRGRIGRAFYIQAHNLWSIDALNMGLYEIFGDDTLVCE
jgi:glycosyltransferase involved in cell wall biosynthesis